MGNRVSAEEAKGAGKDVIQQAQKGSNELYEYVDVNGGGRLVEAFRRARARKNVAEVEELIDAFGSKFLYNNGAGKEVDVAELVQWRHQSREVQLPSKKRKNALLSLFAKWTDRVQDTLDVVGTDYRTLAEGASTRVVGWDIKQRAAVGENIVHLCFLNATGVHYDLAKMVINKYPCLVNDIYISDEYYGESALHMAIVNENQEMVHFLCKNGADIHERAYGAFFCPEDQKFHTYWGEYPLSFAACLGFEDMVRYLLAQGACPNKKDSNGNTVLHMMVIQDKIDMYDLLLEIGCYCTCQCKKPVANIMNNQGLTPLTLAAKMARKEMFQHILTREREVFWQYGEVTCAAFSLKDLDTESLSHLALFDGILHNLLNEKWKHVCRYRFYQLLVLYVVFLISLSVAMFLRPLDDLNCAVTANGTVPYSAGGLPTSDGVHASPGCDPCFLLTTVKTHTNQQVRAGFEIFTLLFAFFYIIIVIREIVFQEGFKSVFRGMVHNPLRLLFTLSCVLLLVALIPRFTCQVGYEDHIAVAALILAWPYSLMFCRYISFLSIGIHSAIGPFVVMIYKMLKKDFLIFFVIYMIFVIGFSQAMFLVVSGYDDRAVDEHLFTRWFAAGLGLIVLSLGEFEELYDQVVNSNSPFKVLGLWARIVLATERMLTPKKRLAVQELYSKSLDSSGDKALIMRLRHDKDREQVGVVMLLATYPMIHSSKRRPRRPLKHFQGKIMIGWAQSLNRL
ncbi:Transient receptor potential cation channel subfamily V member 6 [Acropora cervicornis]|uniref:Transient receptor potential cation channel subfamily V member 6 n=1 Tax=Acropora cervicornis TaxID=6130 RepID=A0AAD9R3C6_ACRCE|nr:Transient receptor potential cation channel subfamily V member 6 [Acropora cervicornis]